MIWLLPLGLVAIVGFVILCARLTKRSDPLHGLGQVEAHRQTRGDRE